MIESLVYATTIVIMTDKLTKFYLINWKEKITYSEIVVIP